MAKSGWARYATHMSKVGGLFLGPISEKSNFTKLFKLLVPEKEALLGRSATNKPETAKKIAERAKMPCLLYTSGYSMRCTAGRAAILTLKKL